MKPELFRIPLFDAWGWLIGPWRVASYDVLALLAAVLGVVWIILVGRKRGFQAEQLLDLLVLTGIFGLLGSRLLFALMQAPEYWNACFHPELPNMLYGYRPVGESDCLAFFTFWRGGMAWYGAPLTATLVAWIYTRRKKLDFLEFADIGVPAIALGHAVSRLGCLMAGCCFGAPTEMGWGLRFPSGSQAYMHHLRHDWLPGDGWTIPLHPTQLIESAGEFVIFLVLVRLLLKRRFKGQVWLTYFIAYSLLRLVAESFRGAPLAGYLVTWTQTFTVEGRVMQTITGLSCMHLLSLVVLLFAVWGYRRLGY